MLYSFSEDRFYHSKHCRPRWNAALCSISSGSSLFAKVHVLRCLDFKGLRNQIYLSVFVEGDLTTSPFKLFKILIRWAQWFSGRGLDLRLRCPQFETALCPCTRHFILCLVTSTGSTRKHGWVSAKSRKRKFVPSSHPGPFAEVASSRKRQTKGRYSRLFWFFVKEWAKYV